MAESSLLEDILRGAIGLGTSVAGIRQAVTPQVTTTTRGAPPAPSEAESRALGLGTAIPELLLREAGILVGPNGISRTSGDDSMGLARTMAVLKSQLATRPNFQGPADPLVNARLSGKPAVDRNRLISMLKAKMGGGGGGRPPIAASGQPSTVSRGVNLPSTMIGPSGSTSSTGTGGGGLNLLTSLATLAGGVAPLLGEKGLNLQILEKITNALGLGKTATEAGVAGAGTGVAGAGTPPIDMFAEEAAGLPFTGGTGLGLGSMAASAGAPLGSEAASMAAEFAGAHTPLAAEGGLGLGGGGVGSLLGPLSALAFTPAFMFAMRNFMKGPPSDAVAALGMDLGGPLGNARGPSDTRLGDILSAFGLSEQAGTSSTGARLTATAGGAEADPSFLLDALGPEFLPLAQMLANLSPEERESILSQQIGLGGGEMGLATSNIPRGTTTFLPERQPGMIADVRVRLQAAIDKLLGNRAIFKPGVSQAYDAYQGDPGNWPDKDQPDTFEDYWLNQFGR